MWVYNADYADYKFSYTSDGTNWSHYSVEPDPYPFSGSFIEHYNSIWNISDVVKNSPNCINWEKIADSSDLNFDRCYDAISFKNNIFIVGGKHETLTSDMDYIYEIYVTPTLE